MNFMENDVAEFHELLIRAFPQKIFFSEADVFRINGEYSSISSVLSFHGCRWMDLNIRTLSEFCDVDVLRSAIDPDTAVCFLPVFMLGGVLDSERLFLEWGVKSLLPRNVQKEERGDWWFSFKRKIVEIDMGVVHGYIKLVLRIKNGDDAELDWLVSEVVRIWKV